MRIYLNLIKCDYSRREVFCYKPKIRMLKINEFYYLVYSFDYPFNQNQRIKSFYHFPQITLQMIFLQKTRSIFEILSVSPCEFLYQTWICLEDFHDKLAVCRVFICEFKISYRKTLFFRIIINYIHSFISPHNWLIQYF